LARGSLAISTVLSTVILTSVLLVVVITASFLANNVVNSQIENAQFDQAKNVVLALDGVVKKVMFKPHSSGYVRTSFWTTIPRLEETGENLTVLVDGNPWREIPINTVKIQGGSGVTRPVTQDLMGVNGSILLTSISDSLGLVHVYYSGASWVSLDYARVRCVYSGTVEFFNGTGLEPYNLVEITAVRVTFGPSQVQEKASFIVQNIGTGPEQLEIPGSPDNPNNFTIRVQNHEMNETRCLTDLGGDPSHPTLINFLVVGIEVSILGGA